MESQVSPALTANRLSAGAPPGAGAAAGTYTVRVSRNEFFTHHNTRQFINHSRLVLQERPVPRRQPVVQQPELEQQAVRQPEELELVVVAAEQVVGPTRREYPTPAQITVSFLSTWM
jgi:hypothetical protein